MGLSGKTTAVGLCFQPGVFAGSLECLGKRSRGFLGIFQADSTRIHRHLQLHLRNPSLVQPRPHPVHQLHSVSLLPAALIPQLGDFKIQFGVLGTQRVARRGFLLEIRLVALNQRTQSLGLLLMGSSLRPSVCEGRPLLLLPGSRLLGLTEELLGSPAVLLCRVLVLSGSGMHGCQLVPGLLKFCVITVCPCLRISNLLSYS
mmetsp:Transcript_11529/g.25565  ORF Transcript_11529/g.25565 Transcript_11529/m.25565 type:complete len:202 (+) Transcript_11529:1183-1788(+)